MSDYSDKLNKYVSEFNSFVKCEMDSSMYTNRESEGSVKMLEAMSYSLSNGGKRIRPVLTMEFCNACGGDYKSSLNFALALEMVHTYSLIHDDLPCMDNDDMRRGKPSNHIVYGYANALLAGDGLLTLAFEEITKSNLDSDKIVKTVKILSTAAGFTGMIAGQVMDLENENRAVDIEKVKKTDSLKTGEMIKAAAVLGCIAAGASEEFIKAAEIYCDDIGLAFQIVDDILDVTSDEETLGKPINSDSENSKTTYVSLLGIEECKKTVNALTENAIKALDVFGDKAEFLKELAFNLSNRKK
jgi:geranylgeranyl diphosphate synthase, type II